MLRGFSPHQLAFMPSLNCVLASDGKGHFKCIDVISGTELSPPGERNDIHLLKDKKLVYIDQCDWSLY